MPTISIFFGIIIQMHWRHVRAWKINLIERENPHWGDLYPSVPGVVPTLEPSFQGTQSVTGGHKAQMKIYLAGPEVFLPEVAEIAAKKIALCARYGFEGVFPLDGDITSAKYPTSLAMATAISLSNEAVMRGCDLLIANLTPFRGASMDCGTAFEVGFMRALGRPVLGYTNVVDDYEVRANRFRAQVPDLGFDGDRQDLQVEAFNLADNLMIDIAVQSSGATVVRTCVPRGQEMTALEGFERCLGQARHHQTLIARGERNGHS